MDLNFIKVNIYLTTFKKKYIFLNIMKLFPSSPKGIEIRTPVIMYISRFGPENV